MWFDFWLELLDQSIRKARAAVAASNVYAYKLEIPAHHMWSHVCKATS